MFDLLSSLDVGDEILQEPFHLASTEAWVGHIPFAFWLIKALRPETFVELGTHAGNSYFAFCEAMRLAGGVGRAFAIDTWKGDEHAGLYSEDVYASVVGVNEARFRAFSTLVRSTFDDARPYFADGSVDLLHIDGLHTTEAVRQDFETWLPTLSDRGVVVFHDINVRERGFGVWRLWDELSARYPGFAFTHSHGLGVLAVGRSQSPMVGRLLELGRDPTSASTIRQVFGAVGDRLYWQCRSIAIREENAALHGRIAALGAEHQTSAATFDMLRDQLAWSRDALARAEEVSRVKDQLIAQVDRFIRDRDAMLRSRDATIDARDRQVDDRDRELAKIRVALAAASEVAQAASPLPAPSMSAAEFASRVRLAEERIENAYRSTTSWRLTRPLRAVMRRLRGETYGTLAGSFAMPDALTTGPQMEAQAAKPEAVEDERAGQERDSPPDARAVVRRIAAARLSAFLASPARLSFDRAPGTPDITVILVLYNSADLTLACLTALAEAAGSSPALEVLVFDNGSTDDTGQLLDKLDGVEIIRNGHNIHFLRGVNEAARHASGRHLLLLNNDAEILPGAIEAAFRVIESDSRIGAVGGRLILPDGTLQEAGAIIWRDGTCLGFGRGDDPGNPDYMFQRDVDYCSGALLLTRRNLFEELGGFDERFAPAYYEETDYCVRLQERGFRVVYHPDVAAIHFEFGSAGSEDAMRLQQRHWTLFRDLHADWLARQRDPTPYPEIVAFRRRLPGSRRVLVIEDRVPHPTLGSGYPRSAHLIGELVALGCDVTLFPTHRHRETWSEVRQTLDARVGVLLYAEASQLQPYLVARRGAFDAILVCRPHNMRFFEAAVGADREALVGGIPLIYDAEAVFERRAVLERRAAGFAVDEAEAEARIADEIALARRADIITSVSDAEVATFLSHGATDVRLLGHALVPSPQPAPFAERDGFVFLGAIHDDNAPNADAVRWFAGAVLPELRRALDRPDLRLRVVGLNGADTLSALDGIDIDLVGAVPDPAVELARARVFVTPTRFAAGIPHKVHLAASLGTPIVATDLIAGQLGWTSGTELLADSDPLGFAAACVRLHEDEPLWTTVRAAALDRVSSETAPARFRDTLRSVLSTVRAEPPRPVAKVTVNVPSPAPAGEFFAGRREDEDYAMAVPFAYAPPAYDAGPAIAAIVHVFYPDLVPEIVRALSNIPGPVDVFLSTDSEDKKSRIASAFGTWPNGTVEIRVVPNRGRDIAPRIVGFRDVLDRYELTLQLHTKKSLHASFLTPWRTFLFETLAGSPETVRSVLEAFRLEPRLGMIAPQHFEPIRPWLSWNGNFGNARPIATRMGLDLAERAGLDFPSGSMFWARSAALRPILDLRLSFDDFPEESSQKEGTFTHGMERLFFHACEKAGYDWIKIADPALHLEIARVERIADPAAFAAFLRDHCVRLTDHPGPTPRGTAPPVSPRLPPGLLFRVGRDRKIA